MFSSASNSNGPQHSGETLFEYLKRKKQISLKQSLKGQSSSLGHGQKFLADEAQTLRNTNDRNEVPNSNKVQSARQYVKKRSSSQKKKSYKGLKSGRKTSMSKQNNRNAQNMSPVSTNYDNQTTRRQSRCDRPTAAQVEKKLPFEEEAQEIVPITKANNRSFISMISPMKLDSSLSNRSRMDSVNLQQRPRKTPRYNTYVKKSNLEEIHFKKSIKLAIEKISQCFETELQQRLQLGSVAKQLCQSLSLAVLQFEQNPSLYAVIPNRLIKSIKSSVRAISNQLRKSELSNHNEPKFDELQNLINQKFNEIQGQSVADKQNQVNSEVYKITEKFELEIAELNREKNRLSREVCLSNKKLDKMEIEYNSLLEKYNIAIQKQNASKVSNQESQSSERKQLLEKIESLNVHIDSLEVQNKNLCKQLKDSEHKFEKYVKGHQKDIDQRVTEREGYLLGEIEVLKNEFSNDRLSLQSVFSAKQAKFLREIEKLNSQNQELQLFVKDLSRNLTDAQTKQQLAQQHSKQCNQKTQHAIQDLYRLNEELYRHWLALKDVKTLLGRLGMFGKFERIFADVPFNELLFATS